MTDKNTFIENVLNIAAENLNGFTVDPVTFLPITSGFSVAVAATQYAFGIYGIERVYDIIAAGEAQAVGGWYNEADGMFYFDAVCIIEDLAEAIQTGRDNEQIAIFDLDNLEEIEL